MKIILVFCILILTLGCAPRLLISQSPDIDEKVNSIDSIIIISDYISILDSKPDYISLSSSERLSKYASSAAKSKIELKGYICSNFPKNQFGCILDPSHEYKISVTDGSELLVMSPPFHTKKADISTCLSSACTIEHEIIENAIKWRKNNSTSVR